MRQFCCDLWWWEAWPYCLSTCLPVKSCSLSMIQSKLTQFDLRYICIFCIISFFVTTRSAHISQIQHHYLNALFCKFIYLFITWMHYSITALISSLNLKIRTCSIQLLDRWFWSFWINILGSQHSEAFRGLFGPLKRLGLILNLGGHWFCSFFHDCFSALTFHY